MGIDGREALLRIAKLGGMERYVDITTRELGELLGISQQSASLHLTRLEERGLIERIRRKSGGKIRVTREGIDLLNSAFQELRDLFEESRKITIHGIVSAGLGEGAYYLSQSKYIDQLRDLFGIIPYPGTLNVNLSMNDRPIIELLRRGPGIVVNGFTSQGRTFGTCLCYRCEIEGIPAVIMVPDRTIHEYTLEIVSDRKIRDETGIDEGGTVTVTLEYPAHEKGCL